jgi:hypothetical protein
MECHEEGPPRRRQTPVTNPIGRRPEVKYVGIDWAYRRAQWCALTPGGEVAGEGQIPAACLLRPAGAARAPVRSESAAQRPAQQVGLAAARPSPGGPGLG